MQAAHQIHQVFENIQKDLHQQAEDSSDDDSLDEYEDAKPTKSVHNFYNKLIQLNETRLHRSDLQIGSREAILEKMTPEYHKKIVLNSDIWFEGKEGREFHDGKGCAVFYPDSPGRVSWDAFGMLMILYQSILVPYRLCFEVTTEGPWAVIEIIIDVCFMVDILVNFNTAYYSQGKLVTSRTQIAINYIKFWFWLDLIASFPYSWVFDFSDDSSQDEDGSSGGNSAIYKTPQLLRLIKFIKFLRILRLLRVLKLKKILVRFEDYFLSSGFHNIMGIGKLIVAVFFIGHWSACFWWSVGLSQTDETPHTWIRAAGLLDAPVKEQYITSLYWAFTTMTTVGYGDIYPVNTDEKLFAIFMMLIASGVFAYIVGSMGALVSKAGYEENKYKETVKEVTNYLLRHEVPHDLKFRVRRYLEFMHEKQSSSRVDENDIFKLVSKPLKERLCIELHGSLLLSHPLFCKFQPNFLSQITQLIREKSFAPSDLIFEEGDFGDKLYFIKNGTVEVFQGTSNTVLTELHQGDYFGDIAFFSSKSRCASARCLDFSDLAFIHKKKFDTILHNYSEIRELCEKVQTKIDDRDDFNELGLRCYLCEKRGHIANKCKSVHLKINHLNLQKRWFFSKGLQNRFVGVFDQPNPVTISNSSKPRRERRKIGILRLMKEESENNDEEQDEDLTHRPSIIGLDEMYNRMTIDARQRHTLSESQKDRNYFAALFRDRNRSTVDLDQVKSEPEVDLELRNQVLLYLEKEDIRDPKAFRMLYKHLRALAPEKRPRELYDHSSPQVKSSGPWSRFLFPTDADSHLTKILKLKIAQLSKPVIKIHTHSDSESDHEVHLEDEEQSHGFAFGLNEGKSFLSYGSSQQMDSDTFSREGSAEDDLLSGSTKVNQLLDIQKRLVLFYMRNEIPSFYI